MHTKKTKNKKNMYSLHRIISTYVLQSRILEIKIATDINIDLDLRLLTHRYHTMLSAMSQEDLSLGVCDQVRFKLACSALDTTYSIEISDLASKGIILSRQQTRKALIRCG